MDFTVQNEGSIFLLRPISVAAKQWVADYLPEDHQSFGGAVVVEHRYIADIVVGIRAEGMVVA